MRILTSESDNPGRGMTETDIIAGLRHRDGEVRRKALEAVCGPVETGVMVVCTPTETRLTVTNNVHAQRVFAGLLFVVQQVAKSLHLELHWVPEMPKEDPSQQLVVAQPEHLPPAPRP
jgi:hypothetical protein